jgi:hypothetical protein
MLHIVLALTLDKVITVHPVTCVSPLEQTGVDNLTNRKYHRRTAVLRLVGDNDLYGILCFRQRSGMPKSCYEQCPCSQLG